VKKVWHEEHTEAEDNDERDLGVGEWRGVEEGYEEETAEEENRERWRKRKDNVVGENKE
jgi:hypothetical protein